MKNLLSEELERYQTLSNYNTKFTLTENTEIISENIILNEQPGAALKTAEEALATLGKDFKRFTAMESGQLTKLLQIDDAAFAAKLKTAMNADIKANQSAMVTARELSKIQVIREISRLKPTTSKQMDAIIKRVKAENNLAYANLRANKVTKGVTGTGKNNKQKAANLGNTPTGKSLIAKIKAGMSWPTLLKVGAGVATVGVLWWLFTSNSDDPQPPQPPEPPQPPPLPPPRPDSKYKTCPDTFPIAMYCKNETVRKVQGCLSIKTDGAFGPGTQTALIAKGLPGNEITQNTVDVACGSKVVEPVVDPNVDLIDGEDPMNI